MSRRVLEAVVVVVIALLLWPVGELAAYGDHTTHKQLTEHTVELAGHDFYGELLWYRRELTDASVAEDADDRALHHFFDPDTRDGLAANSWVEAYYQYGGTKAGDGSARYLSALQWAWDGMRDGRHWRGAIEAYDYTDASKKRAYVALGHVLHLLQDMGQPDHARNRPHPCSWIRGFLESQKLSEPEVNMVVPDRLGYESLWAEQTQWPRGNTARRFTVVESAFVDLARESQKAEGALKLPLPDELASGCGANSAVAGAYPMIMSGPSKLREAIRLLSSEGDARRFVDTRWQKYELAVPAMPTILRPPGDARTRAYLELGRTILPKVEEYGAGLLQLFHDIVNHPPFVHSVVMRQPSGSAANAIVRTWRDAATGWQGQIAAREIAASGNNTLEPDVEAELRISFGPVRGGGDRRPESAPVRGVHAWIEAAGGSAGAADRCSGQRVALTEDTAEPGTFVGRFVPTRSGTVCIDARHKNYHFTQRQHPGDALDANPATPAKATWPPPYEWTGYEPGVDRNHRFAVRADAGCTAAAPSAAIADALRSGTWLGTIRIERETKEFDRLLPGHGQPHARVWTTTHEDATFDATFRALGKEIPPWSNRRRDEPVDFGHSGGTFNARRRIDRRWGDGSTKRDQDGGSGKIRLEGGLASRGDKITYRVTAEAVGVDRRLEKTRGIATVRGELCDDGAMRGSTVRELGRRDTANYSRIVTTWNLSFTPTDPPPHFKLVEGLPRGGRVRVGAYRDDVEDALRPVLVQLNMAGRGTEASELLNGLDEPEQEDIGEAFGRIQGLATDLSALWLSDDGDADANYQRRLSELADAIKSWRDKKQAIEAQYAAATMAAASRVEPSHPHVARKLQQLVNGLKERGLPPE